MMTESILIYLHVYDMFKLMSEEKDKKKVTYKNAFVILKKCQ